MDYQKGLSNKISNKFIDEIYDLGKRNGAYGGKLSGAGGGGFLSFIVEKKFKNKLIHSILKKLKYFPLISTLWNYNFDKTLI